MVDRTRRELSDADIQQIADTYHAWRYGDGYEDVPGFASSATNAQIAGHGYVLTPGRYVGAEEVVDDGIAFPERFDALKVTLEVQFNESDRLTSLIREKLANVVVSDGN